MSLPSATRGVAPKTCCSHDAPVTEGKDELLKKRSFALAGHRTSVALEGPFWAVLEREATARNVTLAALVAEADARRSPDENLASALRLRALAWAGSENSCSG